MVNNDKTWYYSNEVGKEAFVEERLKPLLLSMDGGWEDAYYLFDEESHTEEVILLNKNPEKSLKVNVACDSINALTRDVFRALFN